MVARVFYWPRDVLADTMSARSRGALAMWAAILMTLTLPARYVFKDAVWMVWALSEAAFILALVSIAAAETPVETE